VLLPQKTSPWPQYTCDEIDVERADDTQSIDGYDAAENSVGDKTDNIQDMRHRSSALWCRDMDVTVQRLKEIGCLPSLMPMTHLSAKVL